MVSLSRVILLWRLHQTSLISCVLPATLLKTQCFVSPIRVLGVLGGRCIDIGAYGNMICDDCILM
jgi:hypothetical protein